MELLCKQNVTSSINNIYLNSNTHLTEQTITLGYEQIAVYLGFLIYRIEYENINCRCFVKCHELLKRSIVLFVNVSQQKVLKLLGDITNLIAKTQMSICKNKCMT